MPRTPSGVVASFAVVTCTLACLSSPLGPHLDGEGRRALFIGNSYTYHADIPGIVQALADSAGGDKLAVETVAGPDLAFARVNARPALFSAWPSAERPQDFPRAIESYTLAATDVDGILLPVAAGWIAALDRNSSAQLYADGLHPSANGAYLSALVIYARLFGKSPKGLPSTLRLHSGATIAIDPTLAATLQDAAEAVTSPAPPSPP